MSAKRILVIEDDADMLELYQDVLDGEGFGAETASSATEGLNALRRGPLPDALFLDMTLPDMSGEEFLAELRKDPRFSELKIILISGVDDLGKRAKELGTWKFLRKPFNLGTMVDLLGEI